MCSLSPNSSTIHLRLLNESEILGSSSLHRRKVVSNQKGPGRLSFPHVTIGSLPDNVLLEIFDFCQWPCFFLRRWWHALVHVCRRWRYIVFESPLRLKLRLVCNENTPVKKTLDVWPRAFPIIIEGSQRASSGSNIIAALEHHDRVSEITLNTTCTGLKRLYKAMKNPYPVLTHLSLTIGNWKSKPVLHDSFLGGSAPRLKDLRLVGIPFPALPKLLPFFRDLVEVRLWKIPNTGYISPEAMATALSALTKLKVVIIGFESPASRPDPTNMPPSSFTRVVLPALTRLEFHGVSEYFEDLVTRIDTPAIIFMSTWFFNQLEFDIPRFLQFIGRTQIPESFEEAELYFKDKRVFIYFGHRDPPGGKDFRVALSIIISCHAVDWQVACVAQICGKISPFSCNVERLRIASNYPVDEITTDVDWKDYVDTPQWLELFHAFPALQHVRILPRFGEIIGSALQELIGESVMDAMSMLRHLYLPHASASTLQAMQPFISSRQGSNRPVIVHLTEMD